MGALQHFRQGEPRLLRPGEGSGNREFLKLGLFGQPSFDSQRQEPSLIINLHLIALTTVASWQEV